MNEEAFLRLLDKTDRELDSFPFWSSFKRACADYPVRGIDKITPGRQAILILWQANSQTRDERGNIVNINLDGEKMQDKLDRLKEDLIGHFMNEELDEQALNRFFKSIVNSIKR